MKRKRQKEKDSNQISYQKPKENGNVGKDKDGKLVTPTGCKSVH